MADEAAFKVRRGTPLHACLQRLHAREGEEMSTGELAAYVGCNTKSLSIHLAKAVRGQVIASRMDGGKQMWRLARGADRLLDQPAAEEGGGITRDDERYVSQVSASAVSSVFAFADQRNAAPFSCALHTDGRLLIERQGRVICELTDAERRVLVAAATEGVRP